MSLLSKVMPDFGTELCLLDSRYLHYLLAPEDEPTNPLKVWRGKVRLCDSTHIVVELTEQGYESMTETITYNQVVSIERSPLK